MKDQLVSFVTAVLATEKGCNLESYWYYDLGQKNKLMGGLCDSYGSQQQTKNLVVNTYTQSRLQRWLRKKHNIHVDIYLNPLMDARGDKKKKELYCAHLYYIDTQTTAELISETCSTYEEMLEIGLQKALKLI